LEESGARLRGDVDGLLRLSDELDSMGTTSARITASAAALSLALSGCAGLTSGARMTLEEQLRSRPTFEQAGRDYLAMLDEMRQALSALVPTLKWTPSRSTQDGTSACSAPFTDVPGSDRANYVAGTGEGNIPDQDWPRAAQALKDIARRHGFTTAVGVVDSTAQPDRPAHRVLDIYDEHRDGSVEFGSLYNTTLTVYGACFLHEAAHPGPTPTPAAS
jgi:hypothetical protein